jgi:hypothetical protein
MFATLSEARKEAIDVQSSAEDDGMNKLYQKGASNRLHIIECHNEETMARVRRTRPEQPAEASSGHAGVVPLSLLDFVLERDEYKGRTSWILKIQIRADHTSGFFYTDVSSIPLPIIETFSIDQRLCGMI